MGIGGKGRSKISFVGPNAGDVEPCCCQYSFIETLTIYGLLITLCIK